MGVDHDANVGNRSDQLLVKYRFRDGHGKGLLVAYKARNLSDRTVHGVKSEYNVIEPQLPRGVVLLVGISLGNKAILALKS